MQTNRALKSTQFLQVKAEIDKQKQQQKTGGWFSCFSNTSVENSTSNMQRQEKIKIAPSTKHENLDNTYTNYDTSFHDSRNFGVKKSEQKIPLQAPYETYDQTTGTFGENSTSYYQKEKFDNLAKGSSTQDLNLLRKESQMRLKFGISYQPPVQQDNQFQNSANPSKFYENGDFGAFGKKEFQSQQKIYHNFQPSNLDYSNCSDSKLNIANRIQAYTPTKVASINRLNNSSSFIKEETPKITIKQETPKSFINQEMPKISAVVTRQRSPRRQSPKRQMKQAPITRPEQQIQVYQPNDVYKQLDDAWQQNPFNQTYQVPRQFQGITEQAVDKNNYEDVSANLSYDISKDNYYQPAISEPIQIEVIKSKYFWTDSLVASSMQIPLPVNPDELPSGYLSPAEEQQIVFYRLKSIIDKYNQKRKQSEQDLESDYFNSQRYAGAYGEDAMTQEQFEDAKQELFWDIAWQIFDEVNQFHNTDTHINLFGLSIDEAIPITKQKIFDVASLFEDPHDNSERVLSIKCDRCQMSQTQNYIAQMIGNELGIDHIVVMDVVLVRINLYTQDNPVLKEW